MGATAMGAGIAIKAAGAIYGGMKQKQADDYTGATLTQEAGQSVASGIQGAIMSRRKATYVGSSAQARIAAGGLTTTGASAIDTEGLIRGQGEYNALTSIYQGEDRALELQTRAQGMRNEGSAAQIAGYAGAVSTVLTGGTSFYDKYGG